MSFQKKTSVLALFFIISFLIGFTLTPAMAQTNDLQGKTFEDEYWGIEYNAVHPNQTERSTGIYIGYINVGGVQTIYFASLNMTSNNSDPNKTAYSPYQTIYQHFKVPDGNHVIVQNVFAGLVAYVNNESTNNTTPDRSDKMYFSYTMSATSHRALIRSALQSAIGYDPLGSEALYSYTAKPYITKTEGTDKIEYKFGISYENLFILWHPIAIENDDIENTTSAKILFGRIAAFCRLDSLNFSYVLSVNKSGGNMVKMTTEYNIGQITDLYIPYDDAAKTTAIGGNILNINVIDSGKSLSRYNTTDTITKRLNGTGGFERFSLAVLNYARMIVIENVDRQNAQGQIRNSNGAEVNPENVNATEQQNLKIKDAVDKDAFLIDFASKPNYILDGDTANPMLAPVKLYPKTAIKNPAMLSLYTFFNLIMMKWAKNVVERRYPQVKENGLNLRLLAHDGLYYAICFPQWNGQKINQDPTFVAFADFNYGTSRRIDGFSLSMFIIAALGAIFAIITIRKRKFSL